MIRTLPVRAAASVLLLFLVHTTVVSDEPAQPVDIGEYLAWTAPAVVVNTIPGFGLGSLGQGDQIGFQRGLILDVLGVGLVAGSAAVLSSRPADEPGGVEALTLLAGYGVYAYSRVSAVVRPLRWSRREGIGNDRAFAPAVYNTLPGFGVGSRLQDDRKGASVLAVADATAFGMVGVLSLTALAGQETPAAIAGAAAISSFAFARFYGIVRPARYLHRNDVNRRHRSRSNDRERAAP